MVVEVSRPSVKLRSTSQKKMRRIRKGLTFSSTGRTMKIDFQFYLTWLEISQLSLSPLLNQSPHLV
jgi:hypothetical protein